MLLGVKINFEQFLTKYFLCNVTSVSNVVSQFLKQLSQSLPFQENCMSVSNFFIGKNVCEFVLPLLAISTCTSYHNFDVKS